MSVPSTRRPHVVVANWRDAGHPDAGGAEVYAEQMAAALHHRGYRVTFLAAAHPGGADSTAPDRDAADVRRVRAGGRWTVYPRVAWWLARHRSDVDVVIDCQNGIPFFAPLWVRRTTAVVCVVHHVHTDQFGRHFPTPVAALGRWLEGPVASRVYGRRPAVAVSPSTARGLRQRLGWRGSITVVPNGAPPVGPERDHAQRAVEPTVVSVARLVVHKRLDLLIEAARRLTALVPGVQVRLIGSGPEAAHLTALMSGLRGVVTPTGWLDDAAVAAELDRAWIHVVTTAGEGWGLSVLEAAARGVPTIGFDVEGIRDSVRRGRTGWLLPDGADLAAGLAAALRELSVPDRAASVAAACQEWACEFSWEGSAGRLMAVLETELERRRGVDQERRQVTDDAWVVELRARPEASGDVAARLRRSDRTGAWRGRPWWLLQQCGRSGVEVVLRRLGRSVDDVVSMRPATDEDLLRAVPLRTWVTAP